MGDLKQVIVMRTDLNMRKGKMIAQGAHAAMAFLTRRVQAEIAHGGLLRYKVPEANLTRSTNLRLSDNEAAWIEDSFVKICVRVDSEQELLDVHQAALDAGLESHLITDAGRTEFGGVPTVTCCAIGPDEADKIDAITGGLKLL